MASELSCEMLKIAADKSKPERICLTQSSAEALPFKEASFDVAFATLVFCSVGAPQKAFAELHRVIKPGGRLVLLEHVRPGGLLGPLFDLLNLLTVWLLDDHCNRRTAEEVQLAGFRALSIERRAQGIFNLIVLERE